MMDHFTAYLFVLVILLVREGKLIEVDSAFGKVRHNSRIVKSRLRCMNGALRGVLCTKKLHFVRRKWRCEN